MFAEKSPESELQLLRATMTAETVDWFEQQVGHVCNAIVFLPAYTCCMNLLDCLGNSMWRRPWPGTQSRAVSTSTSSFWGTKLAHLGAWCTSH